MREIFLSLLIITVAISMYAQNFEGSWSGQLDIQGTKLTIVFNIEKNEGRYSSTMDSPDQGAKGIPTDTTIIEGKNLTITAAQLALEFTGTLNEEKNEIKGIFKQGPMQLPLILSDSKAAAVKKLRPQDPKDFPYHREEVKIYNKRDEVYLAGTLTTPKSGAIKKAVILVSGSGPQNRDEELFDHRPFLVLSDHLTRNGIAVLRYDDRGVAGSAGNHAQATTADFANDAEAVIEFLAQHPELGEADLGIIGHSEGGMIAPMVAARNGEVDFIVLLAGPGIPIDELMLMQVRKSAELAGAPASTIELNQKLLSGVYDYLKNNPEATTSEASNTIQKILKEGLKEFPDVDELVKKETDPMLSPWFRYFMTFDPVDYLSEVKCPVLAINGDLDMQVSNQENLAGIEQALKKSGNNNVTIKSIKGLNHLFQTAQTGSAAEYPVIEETFNQEAMTIVSDWIKNLK